MNPTVLFIVGPTACGKSKIALAVAKRVGGEIISADSMQVYKGMDIGTAKPSLAERKAVPHHLIDIVPISRRFSAYQFRILAFKKIREIFSRKRLPMVVGGTGLYVRTLLEGWVGSKPLEAWGCSPVVIGITKDRGLLYSDIERRVDQMFRKGWVTEVERLNKGRWSRTAAQALGYREIRRALAEGTSLDEAQALIKKHTRHYAKRQMTWFRKERGIVWIPLDKEKGLRRTVEKILLTLSPQKG